MPEIRFPEHIAKVEGSPFWRWVRDLTRWPNPIYRLRRARHRETQLVRQVGENGVVLNIGSGRSSFGGNVINLDIERTNEVDIIGDVMKLPLWNGCVDGGIISNVLEHVREPRMAAAEIYRVLRPGGFVYVEVPFLVPYHAHPADFQRYTLFGLQELFRSFEVVDRGVVAGPGSSLAQILRITFAVGLSFGNQFVYKVLTRLFGWLLVPVKYADVLFEGNPMTTLVANGHFLVVQKRISGDGKN